MDLDRFFDEITDYAHYWNWLPDWNVLREIYSEHHESYSVLSPFAYSYLEELIRSTTSDYGIEVLDKDGNSRFRSVGSKLVNLAIEENKSNHEYTNLLSNIMNYYMKSTSTDLGDNRNSVAHGYMHPRFWTKESFEKLIQDIAELSRFSRF